MSNPLWNEAEYKSIQVVNYAAGHVQRVSGQLYFITSGNRTRGNPHKPHVLGREPKV